MGSLTRLAVFVGFVWALAGPFKILGSSTAQALLDGQALADALDYSGDDYWIAAGKRAGFWSPHPSDYNPMRRPNPVLRPSSKRDSDGNPYHPLAKVINYNNHRPNGPEDYADGYIEGIELPAAHTKKHIWPANLMFKLGQGSGPASAVASNRKSKYIPSEPQNNL